MKKWQVVAVVVAIALVFGGPILINESYKLNAGYTTIWGAEEVLAYYGTILGASGAAIGVYLSIRAAQRNYRDDIRNRVLPYIALTSLEKRVEVNIFELPEQDPQPPVTECKIARGKYEEFKLNKLYIVIGSDSIVVNKSLTDHQNEIITKAGKQLNTIAPGVKQLEFVEYCSIPLEIENIGMGAAANLRIGFNKRDCAEPKFIKPITLKPGETVYIHIFSEAKFETIRGEYSLDLSYEDIYKNTYRQSYPVKIDTDEENRNYQQIRFDGLQTMKWASDKK